MATIQNSTAYTFSPATQQAVRNAAANLGLDEVVVGVHPNDGNNGTLFQIFDTDDNYLFSIDTDGDVIFE